MKESENLQRPKLTARETIMDSSRFFSPETGVTLDYMKSSLSNLGFSDEEISNAVAVLVEEEFFIVQESNGKNYYIPNPSSPHIF